MPLLNDVKDYLDITWDDSDSKMNGIIDRASAILSDYAGSTLAFDNENDKQMLLDCCRYIYNHALEDFKHNFSAELFTLRAKYAIIDADTETEEEDAEIPDV